jgi:hypothetical protein
MVHFTSFFVVALSAASALASPHAKRTTAKILSDLSTISSQTTTLDNAILAFPNSGGTLVQALAIHTDAVTLTNTVTSSTNDVKATPALSEADGQSVIAAVTNLVPLITKTLNDIVGKKAAFQSLPAGGIPAIVLSDLKTLNSTVTTFDNALIAIAPADLKGQGTTLSNQVLAAFATAIKAYSS